MKTKSSLVTLCAAALLLASCSTTKDKNLAYFKDLAAQQSDIVKADAALAALGEQLAYTVPQGQYPGDYWSLATGLGDRIIAKEFDDADDAALMDALTEFQDTCISYAG